MSKFISTKICPKSHKEKEYMSRLPNARYVKSTMYAKICIKPYITHFVGVVTKYMVDLRKKHSMAINILLN